MTDVTYTRVGLLSKVAGLFDPLGTAAPMTVKAKIRLRVLGIKGLKWDDAVDGDDRDWWSQYFDGIQRLKSVEVPRCLVPDVPNITRLDFC